MDFLSAQKFADWHECAICGNYPSIYPLENGEYEVRCQNPQHSGFTRIIGYREGYRMGRSIPLHIANQIQAKEERTMANELGEERTRTLAPYLGVTSLTQEQAGMILKTIWPKAPEVEVVKAALICHMYGLNPLMKHLYLVEFKGKEGSTWTPIIGIGATRLIASRLDRYSYLDGPRVMTTKEQEKIRGEVDDKNIWAITILQDSKGNKAPGYGCWPKAQDPYGTDKGNTKQNMALKRSEKQAFDRLFPGEMPQGVEVGDIQFLPPANEKGRKDPGGAPTEGEPPITEAQRKKIFASSRQMGYEDSEVKAIIKELWNLESTKDLSKSQASELIEMIERGEGLSARAE